MARDAFVSDRNRSHVPTNGVHRDEAIGTTEQRGNMLFRRLY